MKLPDKVRIGSIDYEVNLTKGLAARDDVWGLISYGNPTIELEDTLAGSKLREVLAHEMIHGLLHEAGYHDHEEEMVIRLGTVFASMLRDNDFTFMRD